MLQHIDSMVLIISAKLYLNHYLLLMDAPPLKHIDFANIHTEGRILQFQTAPANEFEHFVHKY